MLAKMHTSEGRQVYAKRKATVEPVFGQIKEARRFRRFSLRGIDKVRKRYLSAATAFNLGRIMRSLVGAGKPRHLAVLAERLLLVHFLSQALNALQQLLGPQLRRIRREKIARALGAA